MTVTMGFDDRDLASLPDDLTARDDVGIGDGVALAKSGEGTL